MEVLCRVVLLLGEFGYLAGAFELLEDPQRHQSDDTLTVGRMLPHLDALVGLTVRTGALLLCNALARKFE